ncbi:MAG: alpha/beta hydrolase-fold protein [Robiginitalea sp.]|uniref:alpha/beta hydrolase-fold protein n=1 Tax=Robiginitalea sp. TaxID=1902411 RepID=UPI003C775BFC
MRNRFLIPVIALCLLNCETQKSPEKNIETDNTIVVGMKDHIFSDILQEEREIWVHLPESARNESNGTVKYPVLYLLDGTGHFYSVTGMIKQLSTTNGNTVSPEMIIVGIPNTDRTRDLTPTHVNEMFGDSIFPKTSGGGNDFLNFMEKELIPHIEKNYPASVYKTFVGHSLGGLAVIYALVERPYLFNNYVAIDPSLWWDDQELLKRAEKVLTANNYAGRSLYVGVANTMDEGMHFDEVEKDTSETTEHIRSILQFAKATEAIEANGLNFQWKYYENDSHGSVPLITEYDAVRFLFPWYELKGLDTFFDPSSTASADDLIRLIHSHYKNVSDNFGYEVLPPESFINQLGYAFIDNPKTQDKANALFSMNVQNYPNSSNVYDSMGDCYLAQQDSVKALELFKKALQVGENEYSQEKIDMLNEQLKME